MSASAISLDDLAALQRWMLDRLVQREQTDRNTLLETVLPGANISAAQALGIYQRSYLMRLRLCLGDQFPATRHALGRELFDDFAEDYLRDCPSNTYTLYALGTRFSDWLEATRPDRDLPEAEREDWVDFMIDLARYEHELFRLFDAPGHEQSTWPEAHTADADLVLQPCLSLTQYRYPVAWYYHEVRAGNAPPFPEQRDSPTVILRRDFRTTTYPVTSVHFRFLSALQATTSIESALHVVSADTKQPIERVRRSWEQEVRAVWIAAGFFVSRHSAAIA